MVLLSGLLSGDKGTAKLSKKIVGKEVSNAVRKALPPGNEGWLVIPVVGHRGNPKKAIVEALAAAQPEIFGNESEVSDAALIDALLSTAGQVGDEHGGVLLFVDEMGKFLEEATQQRGDIYIFQQLAEAASRSKGRFVLIGTLHQSFAEYANRLSREARNEWSKIQGRFVDLAINIAGEEQVSLLASAIETDNRPPSSTRLANKVAKHVRQRQPLVADWLENALAECWPLHPATALLLGPISKRRFGQNQRSIFGFLNSAETQGFQHFLREFTPNQTYTISRLWDYLRLNLEPSILASPDGHRWAIAAEAVERCETAQQDRIDLDLLKSIALIDMFKDRSGIAADLTLLTTTISGATKGEITDALDRLKRSSLVIYRNFSATYAIFAGSDFDIEEAVRQARDEIGHIEMSAIQDLVTIQPILAKRHYHDTGSLQWFNLKIIELDKVNNAISQFDGESGVSGVFLLVVPTQGESLSMAESVCRDVLEPNSDWDFVFGISEHSWKVSELATELFAIQRVRTSRAELAGDPVARKEIDARMSELQGQLEATLADAMETSTWLTSGREKRELSRSQLSSLASELADIRFSSSPLVKSELINRIKPSTGAVAARKILLKRMIMNAGEPNLGIEGFPAEAGLFRTTLLGTNLYQPVGKTWKFVYPGLDVLDPANLQPCWDFAVAFLKQNSGRSVSLDEVFREWGKPPYGVKAGLLPLLGVAFIQSQKENLALYREGLFQSRLNDIDIDFLVRDPSDIQVRWMDLKGLSRELLAVLADIVRDLAPQNELLNLEPIEVARSLVAIHDRLPPWTKRTMKLSRNAISIRGLLKHAVDPNKLLFNDIPSISIDGSNLSTSEVAKVIREGLVELTRSYTDSFENLKTIMINELLVPNASPKSLEELRARGENAKDLSDDFKVNAFAGRLSQFDGSLASLESIASLAADKPPHQWTDPDFTRALQNTSHLAQGFLKAEGSARLHKRKEFQTAVHLLLGIDGKTALTEHSITITPHIRSQVQDLKSSVNKLISKRSSTDKNAIIAALSEISAELINDLRSQETVANDN
ncbi:MAG: ATP-binding protein [Oceanococcus sp.]